VDEVPMAATDAARASALTKERRFMKSPRGWNFCAGDCTDRAMEKAEADQCPEPRDALL
jgi:hypothetical protein